MCGTIQLAWKREVWTGNSIRLRGARAPSHGKWFSHCQKNWNKICWSSLSHTNATRKFWDKTVKHFGLRKKNKSKTKCHHKMTSQICFFRRRNTAAPFRMKFVKHACDTNTIIHKFFQNFSKHFYIFFDFTVHPGAYAPGSQNASPVAISFVWLILYFAPPISSTQSADFFLKVWQILYEIWKPYGEIQNFQF